MSNLLSTTEFGRPDLQPKGGQLLGHVAVSEVSIQLDDEQYGCTLPLILKQQTDTHKV